MKMLPMSGEPRIRFAERNSLSKRLMTFELAKMKMMKT